jgi:multifunctional beta-oxidation protein
MTNEILRILDPSWVVPLVAVLVDKNYRENGSIFEVGRGHVAKYRWERSKGALLKCDNNFTAGALLERWKKVSDFEGAEYPDSSFKSSDLTDSLCSVQPSSKIQGLDFTGRVVLVTGGGAG